MHVELGVYSAVCYWRMSVSQIRSQEDIYREGVGAYSAMLCELEAGTSKISGQHRS